LRLNFSIGLTSDTKKLKYENFDAIFLPNNQKIISEWFTQFLRLVVCPHEFTKLARYKKFSVKGIQTEAL